MSKCIEIIRFRTGCCNPCTYYNSEGKLRTLVHGDDFANSRPREQCRCMKQQIEKKFGITTKVMGLGEEGEREEQILNRVVRGTNQGWEIDADRRHADIIIDNSSLKIAKRVI